MQTTTDDGSNLKNDLMHNPGSNNSNTWCSNDGDSDGTCSSGGCDGVTIAVMTMGDDHNDDDDRPQSMATATTTTTTDHQ